MTPFTTHTVATGNAKGKKVLVAFNDTNAEITLQVGTKEATLSAEQSMELVEWLIGTLQDVTRRASRIR